SRTQPLQLRGRWLTLEPLHDIAPAIAAYYPVRKWRVAHCRDRLEHEGLAVAIQDDAHVAVWRMCGALDDGALRRTGCVEDDVAVAQRRGGRCAPRGEQSDQRKQCKTFLH